MADKGVIFTTGEARRIQRTVEAHERVARRTLPPLAKPRAFGGRSGTGANGSNLTDCGCGSRISQLLGIDSDCAAVATDYKTARQFTFDMPDLVQPGASDLSGETITLTHSETAGEECQWKSDPDEPYTLTCGSGSDASEREVTWKLTLIARAVGGKTLHPQAILELVLDTADTGEEDCLWAAVAHCQSFDPLRGGLFEWQPGNCLQVAGCFCVEASDPGGSAFEAAIAAAQDISPECNPCAGRNEAVVAVVLNGAITNSTITNGTATTKCVGLPAARVCPDGDSAELPAVGTVIWFSGPYFDFFGCRFIRGIGYAFGGVAAVGGDTTFGARHHDTSLPGTDSCTLISGHYSFEYGSLGGGETQIIFRIGLGGLGDYYTQPVIGYRLQLPDEEFCAGKEFVLPRWDDPDGDPFSPGACVGPESVTAVLDEESVAILVRAIYGNRTDTDGDGVPEYQPCTGDAADDGCGQWEWVDCNGIGASCSSNGSEWVVTPADCADSCSCIGEPGSSGSTATASCVDPFWKPLDGADSTSTAPDRDGAYDGEVADGVCL